MGSKGRIPLHQRRPLPGPGVLHPDPFGPGIRAPSGAFPFEMLPPPEIMEQKLAMQHVEMERLAMENQRLAATHSSLRQELAAVQQELQRFQEHISAVQVEQEQQKRVLMDRIANMEADLKSSEPIKVELQQMHAEAQNLVAVRQELISKVQQLTQDLQRNHGDMQQIPALISELEAVRQEYQHCRSTYDYERKIRVDHYESLEVMERNYVSMVREVENLRVALSKSGNLDKSATNALDGAYGSNSAPKENDTSGHLSVGQNVYEEGYGIPQARGPSTGTAPYGGGPTGAASRAGYDVQKGPTYDASRIAGYDASRGGSYEAPRASGYEAPRGSGNDAPRGATVGAQAAVATGHNAARFSTALSPSPYGSTQAPPNYASVQGPSPYGSTQPQPSPYGSTQPQGYGLGQTPTRAGSAYEAPRGGNSLRR
ncbi:protein FLX-like 2 [Typha latifolia]|uniref:protein FLX-like 2 n=1 Tax=Typha latifolia TaxID=4733 RepID=UPI003C2C9026